MSEFLGTIWDILNRLLKIMRRLNAISVSSSEYSEQLRECFCDFQLEYTNFHFGASRKHRDFKEAIAIGNEKETAEAFRLLNNYIENGVKKLCGDNAKYIQNYFTSTHSHKIPPRIGIHAVDNDEDVQDIIMLPENSIKTIKKIEKYTCFSHIVIDSGIAYLENNLPKAVVKSTNDFDHSGLNLPAVRNSYKCRMRDYKLLSRLFKFTSPDNTWKVLCVGKTSGPNMYKSHLVVPVTFRAHAALGTLDRKMIEILELSKEGRSILGFICVDHPATYYFDDEPFDSYVNIDINTMYMLADILSFVFITRLMYTSGSSTYREYSRKNTTN